MSCATDHPRVIVSPLGWATTQVPRDVQHIPQHRTHPQHSKASRSQGACVLELLSTTEVGAEKRSFLHSVKGTLFSKAMEVNKRHNAPGLVVL